MNKNRQTDSRFPIFSALTLFCVLLLQVSIRVTLTERAYELEEVRASVMSNDELLREAHLELARVYDPAFIKTQAYNRLGMTATPPQRIRQFNLAQSNLERTL